MGNAAKGKREHQTDLLVNMRAVLDDRSLRVLRLRFVEGYNQTEIASAVGISQQMVSHILCVSINRLRQRRNIIIDFDYEEK